MLILKVSLAAFLLATKADSSEASGGCFEAYQDGESYSSGNLVSETTTSTDADGKTTQIRKNYRCVEDANSAFCGSSGYGPGTSGSSLAWIELDECSGTAAPPAAIAPAAWSGGGCPEVYSEGSDYGPNDVVSKITANGFSLVYRCTSDPSAALWCPMIGFEPGSGIAADQAWSLEGSCEGTIEPTSSPVFVALSDLGACPDEWQGDGLQVAGEVWGYQEGDTVSSNGLVFACKAWPFSANCGQAGFEPDSNPATLGAWKDAWTLVGHCSGSVGPTSSPTFDELKPVINGCPDVFSSAAEYESGDQVSYTVSTAPERKIVYECKPFPYSGYCSQAGFAPGDENSNMAWTLKGACEGTLSPTASPTIYDNSASAQGENDWPCQYQKCRVKEVITSGCTPGSSGCSCKADDGPGPGCITKKEKRVCEAAPVNNYGEDPIGDYQSGDVVRVGTRQYQCRSWPLDGWCRQAAYRPEETDEWWPMGWKRIEDCPATSAAAPAATPAAATAAPTEGGDCKCSGQSACQDRYQENGLFVQGNEDNSDSIPCGSCVGNFSCSWDLSQGEEAPFSGADGSLGDNSCQGESSCNAAGASMNVGDDSCQGEDSCIRADGRVEDDSCQGEDACKELDGNVAAGSCLGEDSCEGVIGTIGAGSCHGGDACEDLEGTVGAGSCLSGTTMKRGYLNDGKDACEDLVGTVADGSCNGDDACDDLVGTVADGSCNGDDACDGLIATVGEGSCQGSMACEMREWDDNDADWNAVDITIGSNSCNAPLACFGREEDVGDNQCNDPFECCNTVDFPATCCEGLATYDSNYPYSFVACNACPAGTEWKVDAYHPRCVCTEANKYAQYTDNYSSTNPTGTNPSIACVDCPAEATFDADLHTCVCPNGFQFYRWDSTCEPE